MQAIHSVTKEDRRGWHIDKTVSISHLLTTIAIAGSVIVWANKMEQRLSVLETRMEHSAQAVGETQRDVRELAAVVRDEVRMLRIEVRDAIRNAKP